MFSWGLNDLLCTTSLLKGGVSKPAKILDILQLEISEKILNHNVSHFRTVCLSKILFNIILPCRFILWTPNGFLNHTFEYISCISLRFQMVWSTRRRVQIMKELSLKVIHYQTFLQFVWVLTEEHVHLPDPLQSFGEVFTSVLKAVRTWHRHFTSFQVHMNLKSIIPLTSYQERTDP